MSGKDTETIAEVPSQITNKSSVNYDNLGDVFTEIFAWCPKDQTLDKPDSVELYLRSNVYSIQNGVSGWALKTVLGYDINNEIVQDDTGEPEVINYTDKICVRDKSWIIPKTHVEQTIRAFVKSVGQDTGGQPNVAAYPLNNEVSVNVTIPAKDKYTISFDANGGTGAPAQQIKWHNETIVLSSQVPTKTGHVFQGWSATQNGTSVDYAAGSSYTDNANLALYAVWKPLLFTVKYDANGGTQAPAGQTKEFGQSVTLHAAKPVRQGYIFKGWSTSKTDNTVAYQAGATYTADADITLYAVWKIITYTITYDANSGTGAPTQQVKEYGKTIAISATAPTKDGHIFQGWSTSATSGTVSYHPSDAYTDNADITLYAVWKIITYTIAYNANGGTQAPADQIKEWNKDITISPTKPVRQGYIFQGWSTSPSGSVQYQPSATYTANADITLYAIWKIIAYTITYDANGGYNAPASQVKEYGKNITLSDMKPIRVDYEFLGWSTTASGSVEYSSNSMYSANANLSLFAVWRKIPFMKMLNGYRIYDEAAREQIFGITTDGTGNAYTAKVKGIPSLAIGASFTMVPHVPSTSKSPTLNINGLGAKVIKQRLSSNPATLIAGDIESWLVANKPVKVVYDGEYWVADITKPDSSNLHGTTPISSGGTGATNKIDALKNLGISWGTAAPPTKGAPNSIYIQIN